MAGLLRQPRDAPAELLLEAADLETGSETELLSSADGAGGPRVSCRRACRAAGRGGRRLRVAAALGCLALACTLALWGRATLGPTFSSSLFGSSVNLDAASGGPSGIPGSSQDAGPGQQTQQCAVDEEYFAGLCYKKCSYLTQRAYPIRTSAMTCCKAHPCGLFNQRHDMGFCSGFSVAGGNSSSCPHPPGSCLPDEEMLLGQCYKKCSMLTNGQYNYRVAAGTCCNEDSEIMCLFPGSSRAKTDPKFSMGGGQGAQAGFHPPLSSLEGVANVTTLPPTSSSTAATTAKPAAATTAGVKNPALPHWYTEMQANQGGAGATATTGAPATTAQAAPTTSFNSHTPAPVPDWAQDTAAVPTTPVSTTAAPTTAAPTTAAPTTAAPTTAAPTTAAPTTAAPTTAAPTTAAPTTAGPATTAAPSSAAPATAAPPTAAPAHTPAAPTAQPSEQAPQRGTAAPAATTAAPKTTMPDWLEEITAKPDDDSSAAEQPARQPPAPAPTPAPAAAAAAPAPAPAGAAQQEASQMPDWAAQMLNEPATQATEAMAPSRSALAQDAPPVPDWAKEYVNGAE